MGIASGHDSKAGQRVSHIARWIVVVAGLIAAAAIVGATMASLLMPGSETIVSAPFRW